MTWVLPPQFPCAPASYDRHREVFRSTLLLRDLVEVRLRKLSEDPFELMDNLSPAQALCIRSRPSSLHAFLGSALERSVARAALRTPSLGSSIVHHPGHVFAGRGGPDFAHAAFEDALYVDITTIDDAGPHVFGRPYGSEMMLLLYSRPPAFAATVVEAMALLGTPLSAEQAQDLEAACALTVERHRPYVRSLSLITEAWKASERAQIRAKREQLLAQHKLAAMRDVRWREQRLGAEELALLHEAVEDLDLELTELEAAVPTAEGSLDAHLVALSALDVDREVHEQLLSLRALLRSEAVLEARCALGPDDVIPEQREHLDRIELLRDELAVRIAAISLVAEEAGSLDRRDLIETCRHLRAILAARTEVLGSLQHEQTMAAVAATMVDHADLDSDVRRLDELASRREARAGHIATWATDRLAQETDRAARRSLRRSVARAQRDAERAEHQLRFVRDVLASGQALIAQQVARGERPLTASEAAKVAQVQAETVRDLLDASDRLRWEQHLGVPEHRTGNQHPGHHDRHRGEPGPRANRPPAPRAARPGPADSRGLEPDR